MVERIGGMPPLQPEQPERKVDPIVSPAETGDSLDAHKPLVEKSEPNPVIPTEEETQTETETPETKSPTYDSKGNLTEDPLVGTNIDIKK